MDAGLLKLLMLCSFPFLAFLSLITWMLVVIRKDHKLAVNFKFLGLSLQVHASPTLVRAHELDIGLKRRDSDWEGK